MSLLPACILSVTWVCRNPYPHTHPAYRNGYPDHSLVVLSSGETIPDIEYKRFASDLNGYNEKGKVTNLPFFII